MLMDYNLYLMNIVFNGIDVNPSIELQGKLICLNDSDQVKISQVFHCEGLLLCILKATLRLVVWNPYLGQTRWVESRYFHCIDRYRYALGYEDKKNMSCRRYKILRFMDDNICPVRDYVAPTSRFCWYEIYDFDSKLWTTLDVTPHWKTLVSQRGVSLKGNTYFCATEIESIVERDDHIICFDFTRERFGSLLRLPFSAGYHDYVTLSCVRDEKLAVLLTHNEGGPYEIEIWITTKIETETVLWIKFLKMDDTGPKFPIKPGSFVIDEEKKAAMGFYKSVRIPNRNKVNFIGEDGYLEIDLGERAEKECKVSVCSYVPSLAQIKQNAGCNRNKQSSLETRRFNQKMWKLLRLKSQSVSDMD